MNRVGQHKHGYVLATMIPFTHRLPIGHFESVRIGISISESCPSLYSYLWTLQLMLLRVIMVARSASGDYLPIRGASKLYYR